MKHIYDYIKNDNKDNIVEYLTADINDLAGSFSEEDRFWIEAVTDLTISSYNSKPTLHISEDGYNWDEYSEYKLGAGDAVYLYIDDEKCIFDGEYNIGGNLLGLFTEDVKMNPTVLKRGINGAFRLTFSKSDVIDASQLMLPNIRNTWRVFLSMFEECKKLKHINKYLFREFSPESNNECCFDMFSGCTSLLNAPDLPTSLSDSCYKFMFRNCTSLTQAPDLPATKLTESCYMYMFSGCTSLTKVPNLPAKSLKWGCYYSMFSNCTSLTKAPDLPAMKLAPCCYQDMFYGCTSLTKAPDLPATTLTESCYRDMFIHCTSLTQAPDLPAIDLVDDCYNSMFDDCTSLTKAPDLPAMKLAGSCYANMFSGCTSLTQAPVLPATDLVYGCYEYLFSGAPLIKYIEIHADPKYSKDWKLYGKEWLVNGSRTGTIKKHHDLILPSGGKGISLRWQVIDL